MLNLRISLPAANIEKMLNNSVAETLFEGSPEDTGIWLRVHRTGRLRVQCEADNISIAVPLRIHAKITWTDKLLGNLGAFVPDFDETDFDITAQFYVSVLATPQWNVVAQTRAGFIWERKPQVDLGLLRVDITQLLQRFIQRETDNAAQKISKYLSEELGLPGIIAAVWKALQLRFRVSEKPELWVEVNPEQEGQRILARQLFTEGNSLQTVLQGPIMIHAILGGYDLPFPVTALPPLAFVADLEDRFDVQVQVMLPFEALSRTLNGTALSLDKDRLVLQLQNTVIQRLNGNLQVNLRVMGELRRGFLRKRINLLMGLALQPALQAALPAVSLQAFTVATVRDPLVRLFMRFFNKRLHGLIEAGINAYLQETDAEVFRQLGESLSDFVPNPHARVKARLEEREHLALEMEADKLLLSTALRGQGSVEVVLAPDAEKG